MSLKKFITGRLKGCVYAYKGATTLIKTEDSIKTQLIIAIVVTAMGFYFDISTTQWMMQCFAIGIVITAEGLNSAIEAIADFIHPDYHVKIGHIKDIAAGAVFFAAVIAIIIGLIIYIPHLIDLYSGVFD